MDPFTLGVAATAVVFTLMFSPAEKDKPKVEDPPPATQSEVVETVSK
jgi:hypothetical protein